MFKQIYESEKIQYMGASEIEQPYTDLWLNRHSLRESPDSFFAEEIHQMNGFFVAREETPYSDVVIYVFTTNFIIHHPMYGLRNYRFDPVTGRSLNDPKFASPIVKLFPANGLRGSRVMTATDGSIWASSYYKLGVSWQPISDLLNMTLAGAPVINGSDFDVVKLDVWVLDRINNIVVKNEGNDPASPFIEIWRGGVLEKTINISGLPRQIFPENEKHVYVYCHNGILNLVNYIEGRIVSTLRAPLPLTNVFVDSIHGYQLYTYDPFYRRILAVQKVPNDEETGACNVYVRGWYPVPIPVKILPPIPLVAPRAGRNIPYLTRLFGDAGEPVSGVHFQAETEGVATTINSSGISDNHGEAVIHATSETSGSLTMNLRAVIE